MIYDSLDMAFSIEGDIEITNKSDIRVTYGDVLEAFLQACRIRLQFPKFSWKEYPQVGVDEHPIGEYNIAENVEKWENDVYTALVIDGPVLSEDIDIQTAPLSHTTVMTAVTVKVDPTLENEYRNSITVFGIIDINKEIIHYY